MPATDRPPANGSTVRSPADSAPRRQSAAGGKVDYEDVEVLLLDRELGMRHLIRGALTGIGFRRIAECRSVAELPALLTQRTIDLMLLDLDTDTPQVCEAIRDIRNGRLGTNPFIVIIAMTWNPDHAVIARTLDAGTDDVLAKPLSAAVLNERFQNLVQYRKGFVVTDDYVGPDRRTEARPTSDLPSIAVPNSLRFKATGDKQAIAEPEQIREALRTVRTHRVYRAALNVSRATQSMQSLAEAGNGGEITMLQIDEVVRLVDDANTSIREEGLGKLAPIGESMRAVADGIRALHPATARHFEVLRLHALAIAAMIQENDEAAKLITEALAKATDILNRQQGAAPPQKAAGGR